TFADQCNFGLEKITTPWVLSLDADYMVPPSFAEELQVRGTQEGFDAYRAQFRYCVYGKPLRGTLYPPRTVLYRRERARYSNDGHGHRVCVDGRTGSLHSRLCHDDRKSLDRWLTSQQ